MEKAEKWIFLMVGSVIGMFTCSSLVKIIDAGGVSIWGKALALIFGAFCALWIVSFVEFIIVMVKNKRRKRG